MSIETSNSKRKILVWGIILCVACICAVAYLIISRQMTIPFIYRLKAGNNYTIVTAYSSNPLEIANDSMQPLAWENFLQHPLCRFMADPFIVREGDDFYIFYEEMPSKLNSTWGDIAVLHSRDLQQWERIGVVLDEPFHLSFPNVFKYNGEWYMLPETGAIQEVRIYKAVDFPLKWSHAHTLLTDDYVLDPAIVQWHDIWYLLYNSSSGLRLCYADYLYAEWHEHPASPVRIADGLQETRPAGNFLNYNNSLYYFVQRHDGGYGTSVVAYQIDSLSPSVFKKHRLANNPVVEKHGSTYAKDGMHQFSCIYLPEQDIYFCVMDGNHVSLDTKWGWDWKNLPKFRLR